MMKHTNNTPKKRIHENHLGDALAKGALVWGPAYALGATTAAYWLAIPLTGKVLAYSEILANALPVFAAWGMVAESAKWMIRKSLSRRIPRRRKSATHRNGNRFLPRIRPTGLRPKHA
ncbi:hypothetical protein [Pontiella sp.]|uniref:hypothetical protein n=2 Tax=Pontiella sp. TaxID=2837462 RepID=UPI0035662DE2